MEQDVDRLVALPGGADELSKTLADLALPLEVNAIAGCGPVNEAPGVHRFDGDFLEELRQL